MGGGGDIAARIAVIWVHYHTPDLLRESVASVMADLPATAGGAELIVVDNGGLDTAPPGTRVMRPDRNVGYAGGINLGVSASRAPIILVMNPDVLVRPDCIPALVAALGRHAIVAPDLYLDRACRFRLPPTEACDFVSTCIAALGRQDPRWTRLARHRWRRHAHRYWRARPGRAACHASGAMLGFTRDVFRTLGPWDAAYQLYFEETDWLARAQRAKLTTALIPAARAVHLYARSSRHQPSADIWFAGSRNRFEHKHFNGWQNIVLRRIRTGSRERTAPRVPGRAPAAGPAWMELSNAECGYPAAVARVDGPTRPAIPPEVREQFARGAWWLRWVSNGGRELGVCRLQGDGEGGRFHG